MTPRDRMVAYSQKLRRGVPVEIPALDARVSPWGGDAVVAGGVSLKRLDSLASLCEHLRRYADIKPARRKDEPSKKGNAGSKYWRDALAFWVAAAEREVFVSRRIAGTAKRTDANPPRSLSVADVVDVFAHCRTACKVLTFRELAFSLVFAEAARRALRLDLIKHHRE